MKQIASAFENFAFKSFDFGGRATLLEYWIVMPVVWGLIAFLLYGDVQEIWGTLLARQIPTMNPLYWDGVFVFLLTLIPRASLTVRRLHDSGKSGKWVKLPIIALISGIVLVLGVFSAMASTNAMSGGAAMDLTIIAIFMAVAIGSIDSAWDAIFATVAAADALGWDAIIALLAEWTAPAANINIGQGASNLAQNVRNDPGEGTVVLLMAAAIIATPFVAIFLHFFFMISPTKPDHELDSHTPMSGASLRKQGDTSDNPFAGYKHLYEKTPEQKAAAAASAKEEIRSLYQQRVLGSQ